VKLTVHPNPVPFDEPITDVAGCGVEATRE
jgi:hypothetical protein